jgi:hypothetical protein
VKSVSLPHPENAEMIDDLVFSTVIIREFGWIEEYWEHFDSSTLKIGKVGRIGESWENLV